MSIASRLFQVPEISARDLERARDALSLGTSDMALQSTRDEVRRQALIMQLADNIDQIAQEIGIKADDESILNIATTLCVNGDTLFSKGHPLSPSDRNVALAVLTHWAKATSPRRSSEEVRTLVEQTLDFGETGRSPVKPPEQTTESTGNKAEGGAVAPRKMNPYGATGFGLGIASVLLSFIGIIPLLGIIFSVVGLFTHDEAKHDKKWQAQWGLGLNIVFMLVNMSMWGHF